MKNEGKARVRALLRLNPVEHERYLKAERARKKDAALRAARGEHVLRRACKFSSYGDVDCFPSAAGPASPPWKQQARQRVAADLQALERREAERAARGQLSRERLAALAPSARF